MLKQTYAQDEVEEILRKSVRRSLENDTKTSSAASGVEREQILTMAAELGISPATVEAVLSEHDAERVVQLQRDTELRQREEFITSRKIDFHQHAIVFAGVLAVQMIALWLQGTLLPTLPEKLARVGLVGMLVWAVVLIIHGAQAYARGGDDFESEFKAWRRKHKPKAPRVRKARSTPRMASEESAAR